VTFEETYKELQKLYGKKIYLGKDAPVYGKIPTGSLALDLGLDGGWPCSRITSIQGRESVGKTKTCLSAVAQAQKVKPDKHAAWVAMEPFDKGWAITNGVDVDKLFVAEAETGEEATNIAQALLNSKDLSILVFDSIGQINPKRHIENEAENKQQGERTKVVKVLCEKLTAALKPTKEGKYNECAVLLINHIYDSMDMYKPYVVAGGQALRSACSLMVTFLKKEEIWEGKKNESNPIGVKVNVKVEKDKVRGKVKPFEFSFFNVDGWDGDAVAGTYNDLQTIIDLGQLLPDPKNPLVQRTGAWYQAGSIKAQGEVNLWNELNKNPEERQRIEDEIRKCYNLIG
jgi:recombination protein RecA